MSLNRAQYGSQGDEVKMDVDEYNAMLNERDGGDRAEGQSQSPEQKTKGSKLPAISMSLKVNPGAEGKGKSYAASSKIQSGRGASKGDGLYKTGLKSTGLVIEQAKETTYQPVLDELARREAMTPMKINCQTDNGEVVLCV